jgi:ankyrin repeat protein
MELSIYLSKEGNTPLHRAAYSGKAEVVGILLNGGADVGAVNKVGD